MTCSIKFKVHLNRKLLIYETYENKIFCSGLAMNMKFWYFSGEMSVAEQIFILKHDEESEIDMIYVNIKCGPDDY